MIVQDDVSMDTHAHEPHSSEANWIREVPLGRILGWHRTFMSVGLSKKYASVDSIKQYIY